MESSAYVGLGSNLQNPQRQIEEAIHHLRTLPGVQVAKVSPLYQSRAVGPPQPDFINAVVLLLTQLNPLSLLDALQAVEQRHHRERNQHWGPRTLDLDLLLYDNEVIEHPRLRVPHPYLPERAFVLQPLWDIAPELVLPNGEKIQSLLVACNADGLVRLVND